MRYSLLLEICLFVARIRRKECLHWARNSAFNGFRSTNSFDEIAILRKFDCAALCSRYTYCVAFIHVPQESMNCQLFGHILTSTNGLVASMNATYYALVADDDGFVTKELSPGQSITFKIVTSRSNHGDATNECENMGGFLVRISTETRKNFLQNLIKLTADYENQDFFVDGSNANADDFADINQWKFSNGESLPPSIWTGSSPDSYMTAGYNCLQLLEPHWNFDDTSCSGDYNYYICEK